MAGLRPGHYIYRHPKFWSAEATASSFYRPPPNITLNRGVTVCAEARSIKIFQVSTTPFGVRRLDVVFLSINCQMSIGLKAETETGHYVYSSELGYAQFSTPFSPRSCLSPDFRLYRLGDIACQGLKFGHVRAFCHYADQLFCSGWTDKHSASSGQLPFSIGDG